MQLVVCGIWLQDEIYFIMVCVCKLLKHILHQDIDHWSTYMCNNNITLLRHCGQTLGHFTKQMSFMSLHHNMCNTTLPSHSKCHSCLFTGTWVIQPSSANRTFAVLGSLTATSSVDKHGSYDQIIYLTKNSTFLYLKFKSDKH